MVISIVKKMTARQFLSNPTGKGSATVARRDRIKLDMNNRYYSLYRKSKNKFNVRIFQSNDNFYFVFKIPSEFYSNENLTYDVVIEFSPPDSNALNNTTLERYNIRFFSNSPNFMFTYAYIYQQDGMLIPWLKGKISNKALTEPPEVRNPREEYGFEKSVYFALLYIQENPRLMRKSAKDMTTKSRSSIVSNIRTSNQKLKEYNEAKKKHIEKEKKRENRIDQRVINRFRGSKARSSSTSIDKPTVKKSKSSNTKSSIRRTKKARKSTRRTR